MVCLVLGAIVNVAVAWSLSAFVNHSHIEGVDPVEAQFIWRAYAQQRPSEPQSFECVMIRGAGSTMITVFPEYSRTEIEVQPDWVVMWRCGWPKNSFAAGIDFYGPQERWTCALKNPISFGALPSILPYQPLSVGLIVNTTFFAALVWLCIRGPVEARRRWREYKHRCGACGYPRGASPVCTECGADLSRAWFRGVASATAK